MIPEKYWNITQNSIKIEILLQKSLFFLESSVTFQRKIESFSQQFQSKSLLIRSELICKSLRSIIDDVVCGIMRCLIWMYKRHLSCLLSSLGFSFMFAYVTHETLLHPNAFNENRPIDVWNEQRKQAWMNLLEVESSNQKRAENREANTNERWTESNKSEENGWKNSRE